MALSQRAYGLIVLATVLAIAGIWSRQPGLESLWLLPGALLLLGLAVESAVARRIRIVAHVETAARAFLGRGQAAAFVFSNSSPVATTVEFAPVLPDAFDPLANVRQTVAPAHGAGRYPFTLLPVRLGSQPWPQMPARIRGVLGLAWWSRGLRPISQVSVTPDTLSLVRTQPRGNPTGPRVRRIAGSGGELHQLRGYRYGDPLTHIDWKATARTRNLVTRELSEDQHLDILVAIDAGRFSRVRAGALDRLGLYANIAARFAEIATPNDDHVGLMVFSDRPLVTCAPARGLPAVRGIRQGLEGLTVQAAESDPVAAAVRIRGLLKRRALVVLMTDFDDSSAADALARAVRLLSPPHLVLVAGIRNEEVAALAVSDDPWVALAAQEHDERVALQRSRLIGLGAPVVMATPGLLEKRLFAQYETLRRSRRV
jgi:uncharacterized protein (DUF58 family)